MYQQDCSKYESYNGEHLACELQNEQLSSNYWGGFAAGGLLFFIAGLALMWVICWFEKKESNSRRPY